MDESVGENQEPRNRSSSSSASSAEYADVPTALPSEIINNNQQELPTSSVKLRRGLSTDSSSIGSGTGPHHHRRQGTSAIRRRAPLPPISSSRPFSASDADLCRHHNSSPSYAAITRTGNNKKRTFAATGLPSYLICQ